MDVLLPVVRGGGRRKVYVRSKSIYLHCFQSVEVETATRRVRVEQYGDYAPVNENSVIRTRSIVGLFNKHKRGD